MAFPTVKAGTTHVDAGTDRPSDARADIKQNIENVNAIIDEFNISSPNDGDILQYSSSTGQWEQVAGSFISIAKFNTNTSQGTNISGNIYRRPISSTGRVDTSNIVTFNADNERFTLGAGTYIIQAFSQDNDDEANATIVKESDDTNIVSVASFNEVGTTGEAISMIYQGFTLTESTEMGIRQNTSNSNNRNCSIQIMLFKVA